LEAFGMQSAQTLLALVFGSVGALIILLARYEEANHDIRRTLIISWMAKHTIGLLLIIIAVLIFLSQFITRR
jgi:H+/Cl- antiporter ClcA